MLHCLAKLLQELPGLRVSTSPFPIHFSTHVHLPPAPYPTWWELLFHQVSNLSKKFQVSLIPVSQSSPFSDAYSILHHGFRRGSEFLSLLSLLFSWLASFSLRDQCPYPAICIFVFFDFLIQALLFFRLPFTSFIESSLHFHDCSYYLLTVDFIWVSDEDLTAGIQSSIFASRNYPLGYPRGSPGLCRSTLS